MLKSLIFFLLPALCFAQNLKPVSSDYKYHQSPEYLAILGQLKLLGDFSDKSKPDTVVPVPGKMSRGEQVVAQAKARNKALIAAQTEAEKVLASSEEGQTELQKWKLEEQKTLDGWKKEEREQRQLWQKEQEIFLGRLKVYEENTFVIPAAKEIIIEKKVIVNLPEAHIVNGAFNIPVRDQSARATCAAFAGVRAMEVILSQNKVEKDLSEQYFYWAGKPDCQKAPCQTKGSWVRGAYQFSRERPQIDIPTEANCAYVATRVEKNETQLPLPPSCQQGAAKVVNFTEVRTLADVVDSLKLNIPVIMAAKLSENFYKNHGLVTLADSKKHTGPLDSHSLGHAFLAVGVMELPEKIRATEGSFCLVVANSWGKGWGAGGYSCLTEKWLSKYRQPSPFIAVTEISAK